MLIVAGSLGKTGAAHLARSARCVRAPGWSRSRLRRRAMPIVASMGAEYMTRAHRRVAGRRSIRDAVDEILESARDVLAIGPGLGQAAANTCLHPRTRRSRRRCRWCVDADGAQRLRRTSPIGSSDEKVEM